MSKLLPEQVIDAESLEGQIIALKIEIEKLKTSNAQMTEALRRFQMGKVAALNVLAMMPNITTEET